MLEILNVNRDLEAGREKLTTMYITTKLLIISLNDDLLWKKQGIKKNYDEIKKLLRENGFINNIDLDIWDTIEKNYKNRSIIDLDVLQSSNDPDNIERYVKSHLDRKSIFIITDINYFNYKFDKSFNFIRHIQSRTHKLATIDTMEKWKALYNEPRLEHLADFLKSGLFFTNIKESIKLKPVTVNFKLFLTATNNLFGKFNSESRELILRILHYKDSRKMIHDIFIFYKWENWSKKVSEKEKWQKIIRIDPTTMIEPFLNLDQLLVLLNFDWIREPLARLYCSGDYIAFMFVNDLQLHGILHIDKNSLILTMETIYSWNRMKPSNFVAIFLQDQLVKASQDINKPDINYLMLLNEQKLLNKVQDKIIDYYSEKSNKVKLNTAILSNYINKVSHLKKLVIFIDGLSLFDILESSRYKDIIRLFDIDFGFAELPTVTEYFYDSIKICTADNIKNVKLETYVERNINEIKHHIFSNPNEKLLVLYDVRLDNEGRTKDSVLEKASNRMINDLISFCSDLQDENLWDLADVIVISDHGLIETDEILVFDNKMAKKPSRGAHHRYILIDPNKYELSDYSDYYVFFDHNRLISNNLKKPWGTPKANKGLGIESKTFRSWHGGISFRECFVPVLRKKSDE